MTCGNIRSSLPRSSHIVERREKVRGLLPVVACRGISPSQAARSRPHAKSARHRPLRPGQLHSGHRCLECWSVAEQSHRVSTLLRTRRRNPRSTHRAPAHRISISSISSARAGRRVADVFRKSRWWRSSGRGIAILWQRWPSGTASASRRSILGALQASDVKRLRQLEAENARLKKLVAERDLEIEVMKEVAAKKW